MSTLATQYQRSIVSKLREEFGITNVHQTPKLVKVNINVGLGRAMQDSRAMEVATNTLRKISGQQPLPTQAKHSIAAFKLREGQKIGLKVTLRREMMYDFLERLITVVLPRVRDFHGLSRRGFDKSGNYSLGLTDQSVFPELTYEETTYLHGLQITIVTSARSVAESAKLLELLGLPLEKEATHG